MASAIAARYETSLELRVRPCLRSREGFLDRASGGLPGSFDLRGVDPGVLKLLLEPRDGIALEPRLELTLGPVLRRVAPRVALVAVRECLDERGSVAAACPLGRTVHRFVHHEHVVSVYGLRLHRVGGSALGQPVDRRCAAQRAVLAVEVVLAYEHDRQAPHRCQVQRFVERSDVGRTVAEEGEADRAAAPVLRCECDPVGDRKMSADDRKRAQRSDARVRQVHRAAKASTEPVRLAHDLGERPVKGCAHREHRTVAPVGAQHLVAIAQGMAGAHRDRFLTLAKVGGSAHQPGGEEVLTALLEVTDLEHRAQVVLERGGRSAGGDGNAGCGVRHRGQCNWNRYRPQPVREGLPRDGRLFATELRQAGRVGTASSFVTECLPQAHQARRGSACKTSRCMPASRCPPFRVSSPVIRM
jgi:hypothetical protein